MNYRILIIGILLTAFLASCDIKGQQEPELKIDDVSLYAYGKNISWEQNDSIAVYDGYTIHKYMAEFKSDTSKFLSHSTLNEEAVDLYAMYPYESETIRTEVGLEIDLKSQQDVSLSAMDTSSCIYVAYTNDIQEKTYLNFQEICSYFSFSVKEDYGIVKVVLSGADDEYLAGKFEVTFSNKEPQINVLEGVNEVSVSSNSSMNGTYQICLLPVVLQDGLTVTFVSEDGSTAQKKIVAKVDEGIGSAMVFVRGRVNSNPIVFDNPFETTPDDPTPDNPEAGVKSNIEDYRNQILPDDFWGTPMDPTPEDPVPEDPTPDDPTPDDPTPEDPTPEDPTPEEPSPEDPTPEEPTPEEPLPEDPTSDVESNVEDFHNQILPDDFWGTPMDPTPEDPVPENPVPENPSPEEPSPEDPTPEDPTPEEPTPEDPTPEDPTSDVESNVEDFHNQILPDDFWGTPMDPTPEDPVPEDPTPEEPSPEDPTPEDPTPEDPTPEDPTPEDPTPEDPTSDVESNVEDFHNQILPDDFWGTPMDPTPEDPVPENPTPEDPTPEEPTPEDPTPEEPSPEDPTPEYPVPEDPTPEDPTPEDPTPEEPLPEEPTSDVESNVEDFHNQILPDDFWGTPMDPTPEDPVPEDPSPEDPTPEEPSPEDPTPEEPTPEDPSPEDPTPENPGNNVDSGTEDFNKEEIPDDFWS